MWISEISLNLPTSGRIKYILMIKEVLIMRYKLINCLILFVAFMLVCSIASASTLNITTYTDTGVQDYQRDDSLQLGLAGEGIIAETFDCIDPGSNPIAFGTTTSDAVGYGDYGLTFATNDWWDTGIVYSFNVNSRWWKNNNTLKDITIWVLPTADARRHYNFQVQYTLNDGAGVYYDAVNYQEVEAPDYDCTHITDHDDPTPSGYGTKIELTDIDVANVSQIWIWATPYEDGFQKFSTTIAEIDVNFENCSSYPIADINADCSVDFKDLEYIAEDWLINK
jgi:hypothetical protein